MDLIWLRFWSILVLDNLEFMLKDLILIIAAGVFHGFILDVEVQIVHFL